MKYLHEAKDILGPVQSPEGRFHHDRQPALYLSASPEGTVVASRRYMRPEDPPRAIFPLRIEGGRIVDLRDPVATAHFGIDTTHHAVEWQPVRAAGHVAPTWAISDRIRALGFDGMLYASRSDPSKTHLTLFRWNSLGGPRVGTGGPPIAFTGDVRS
jgi:RES domain-containing protein